jgi:hypothetical protein
MVGAVCGELACKSLLPNDVYIVLVLVRVVVIGI